MTNYKIINDNNYNSNNNIPLQIKLVSNSNVSNPIVPTPHYITEKELEALQMNDKYIIQILNQDGIEQK